MKKRGATHWIAPGCGPNFKCRQRLTWHAVVLTLWESRAQLAPQDGWEAGAVRYEEGPAPPESVAGMAPLFLGGSGPSACKQPQQSLQV